MLVVVACRRAPTPTPDSATDYDAPVCSNADDLGRLEGKRVLLSGIYRKRPSPKKMPAPGEGPQELFLGYAAVEVNSRAPTRSAWVNLGTSPRSHDEVERFDGHCVEVSGTLSLALQSDVGIAQPMPKLTLVNGGKVRLRADCP